MSINLSGRALKRLSLPVVNYYSSAYQVMSAQAGDVNTRYLDVVLYDDRGDIDLSAYSKVYLQVQAYDGISPQMSEGWIDTERNRAVCRLTSSMLQYTGSKMPCNIWLVGTDADDEPMSLTSQTFYVMVYEGHGGADAEPSEDELTVLQSAINDVVELEKSVGEAEASRRENFRSVYIKYSFDANGYNYTDSWQQGQQYMGVANTPKEPEDATGYSWILISGGSSGGSAVTVVGKNGYGFYRLAGEHTSDTTNVATEDIQRRADREVQAGDMLITLEGLIFVLDEYDADNDTQKVSYYTDIGGGDVSEEAIAAAVEMYMSENEIDGSGADDIDIVDSDGSYKLILTKDGEHIGSGVNMPTYTAEDVGAAEKGHDHDEKYQPKGNYAAEGHNHDGKYQPAGSYLTDESDPTVPSWAKQPTKPTYTADEVKARPDTWMPTAEEVGARPNTWTPTASDVRADEIGTAASKVTDHNASPDAHNDIRLLIQGLNARLTALADSNDTTLDQLSELVAYIKDNRELIKSITTDKVNVDAIVDNLTTNDAKVPLSAAQGVAIKTLIDNLTETVNGKQTAEQVTAAIANALKAYPTTSAMQTAISTAMADYAKADHNHDDAYAAKSHSHTGVYQPAGSYADAEHNHDGTYAKPADIPTKLSQLTGDSTHRTVTDAEKTGWSSKANGDHDHDTVYVKNEELASKIPTALPSPKRLIINGIEYDGSKEVTLQLDDAKIVPSVNDLPVPSKDYEDIYFAVKNEPDADGKVTGDIYWCIEKFGHTNVFPTAQPLDSEATELKGIRTFANGYWPNLRIIGTDGRYEAGETAHVSGLFEVSKGAVVTMRNIVFDNISSEGLGGIALFYHGTKTKTDIIENKHIGYYGTSSGSGSIQLLENGDYQFTVPSTSAYDTVTHARVQFSLRTPDPSKIIIVVNEPIKDYDTGWYWEDTGVDKSLGNDVALIKLTKRVTALEEGGIAGGSVTDYGLPDYWDEHLDGKIATIKEHLSAGGRNAFAYVVMTDLHAPEQRASYTGKLARRIMDECKIKNALDLGDHTSRGYIDDRATSDAQFDACRELVAPIAEDILPTQGNHDGTMSMSSGTVAYYTPAEALDQVYGGMRTDIPIVWDEHGTGYYADDRSRRIRYIMLNTCSRGDFAGDLVANGGYTYFRFTQGQYDLVKEALSTMPNDRWRVVVASHVPPVGEADRFGDGASVSNLKTRFPDAPEMRKLLAAYVNRGTASIDYVDASVSYGNAKLTADFSNAKGRLIAYHTGHLHVDLLWNVGDICDSTVNDKLAFPILGHRCDSFNEAQGSTSSVEAALKAERVAGTVTEHSFDVVVVDPDNDVMNLIKIGAGGDRIVYLEGSPNITPSGGNYADPTSDDWKTGYRFDSSCNETPHADYPECIITNYIPFERDSNGAYVVYIKGLNIKSLVGGSAARTVLYTDIGSKDSLITTSPGGKEAGWATTADGITTLTWGNDAHAPKYIRISGTLTGSAEDVIITVNEEIK